MSIHTIITHPGGAHKDDLLACSLLVSQHRVPILRKEPTEAELDDPEVCVVDIGHRHEPERMNFDHHQFPREHVPTCALSLVLQHLGLYDDARLFCDWLETTEWLDTRGPNKTSDWLEVPRETMAKLNSPVDITMLRRFAGSFEHKSGETIYEMMAMIGSDLVEYLQGIRQKIDYVSNHVQRWEVVQGEQPLLALFMPRSEDGIDDPNGAMARYIIVNELTDQIAAMVYPDSRGSGYGISRFNDHPRLDFNRIAHLEGVHFVHNSGFLAKTSVTDVEVLKQMLALAWH